MDRDQLLSLAAAMQADPSRAPALAQLMLRMLPPDSGPVGVPPGYVYHGAHKLIARVEQLGAPVLTDTTPPILDPGGATPSDPIRVPFDAIIFGVGGAAQPRPNAADGDDWLAQIQLSNDADQDGRELFACGWEMDGQEAFITDGRDSQLAPACIATGTQENPRPLYWEVQRGKRIVVSFKSLLSTQYGPPELLPDGFELPPINAEIAFYALNVEAP